MCLVEAMCELIEQIVPSLQGNLDASDLVRQVNELENSLLANALRLFPF